MSWRQVQQSFTPSYMKEIGEGLYDCSNRSSPDEMANLCKSPIDVNGDYFTDLYVRHKIITSVSEEYVSEQSYLEVSPDGTAQNTMPLFWDYSPFDVYIGDFSGNGSEQIAIMSDSCQKVFEWVEEQ